MTHIAPLADNAPALGADFWSNADCRAAGEEAMRTGNAVLTRQLAVIEGPNRVPGCLLLVPVYATGAPLTSPADRERALQGWVYAKLRVSSLLDDVVAAAEEELDFAVFDGDEASPENLLLRSTDDATLGTWKGAGNRGARLAVDLPGSNYGRTWLWQLRTNATFDDHAGDGRPGLILAGGVLLSFLAAGFTWTMAHSRGRALRLAEDMTASLRRAEAEFRFIFETAPIGLSWLWVGADGTRRRLTNASHLQIIGLTPEAMREPGTFRRITHPEDWARQQTLYQQLERGDIDRFSIKKR